MTPPNTPAAAETRPDAAPSRNGANLSDRVRSLRLSDKTQGGGGSRSSVIPWTVCALLVLMTAAFGYRAYMVTPVAAPDSQAVNPAATPATGTTSTASAASGELALEVKGYITPIHQIQVSPKIGGQLVWLAPKFEEGAFFKKGDELAHIEDVDYKTDHDHYKSMHASAMRDLEEQKANLEQLRLNLKRTSQLASTNAAAAADYEVAKYGFDALERRVFKFESTIEMAKADLAKAKWRLDNTIITAPVTGTILTKKAEWGNLVNPSAFSNGLSASLCDMADLTELEVEVKVLERDRPSVFAGQKCWVMPESFQRDDTFRKEHPRGYEGVVSRIMPNADRSANAIPVRVKVLFSEEEVRLYHEQGKWMYLIPDMSATVSFLKSSSK
jgi:RND family efflux transporter MFP subunit